MAQVVIDVVAHDNFSSTLGNFGSIITGIESAINLAGQAFRTFTDFAMQGLDAIASYERLEMSLQSLVASQMVQAGTAQDVAEAMQMAGEQAAELVRWNEELAIKSPFTSEGVAQAFRMAMAYGFTTDEAQRLTEAMIDFAAGTGATEFAMQQIARALGQISATGKLTGGDMLQLVNAGLPVAEILADAFGVTTAQIMDMREKGLIPAQDAIEAITVYLETNFAGAAEAQANSWAGLQGTFEDLKQMGLREFFGGLFEVLQPLAIELSEWLQGPGLEQLREWGALLGQFTQTAVDKIPEVVAKIQEMRTAFEEGGVSGVLGAMLGEVDAQVIVDWLDEVDAQLAIAVENHDWSSSGDSFGAALTGFLTGDGLQSQDSRLIPAIGDALNRWLLGAVGAVSWEQWADAAGDNISRALNDFFRFSAIQDAFRQIGADIVAGLSGGISFESIRTNISTFITNVINYFKTLLGIASPSTVFMQIGKDIVAGLINGITSMFPNLTSIVGNMFNLLTGGGGGTGGASANVSFGGGSTGSIGGRDMGSLTTSGSMTGGAVINNYFYGAVYVGSMGELYEYDCPPNNPLITGTTGGHINVHNPT